MERSSNSAASGRGRIPLGAIPYHEFYHVGAVVRNLKGEHVKILGVADDAEHVITGWKATNTDPAGAPLNPKDEPILIGPPQTVWLKAARTSDLRSWGGPVQMVKSSNPKIPDGTRSTDPSLMLVPYGPHFGRPLGALTPVEREALLKTASNPHIAGVIRSSRNVPEFGSIGSVNTSKLPKERMDEVVRSQGVVVRSIPLVTVMEQFCGYAPEEIRGSMRKYRVGSELLQINAAKNQFGSLNEFTFKTLRKPRGSTNNALDLVAGVREMEGRAVDWAEIRSQLVSHFNLQPQLDQIFQDALARERRGEKAPLPVAEANVPQAPLKQAVHTHSAEEEVEFDLAAGVLTTATAEDRERAKVIGGGFAEREDLWPKARQYLVEERGLPPEVIDYLYEARNLYAARRTFPSRQKFPLRANYEDVIVAPVFGFQTGKIVGLDTKPIPREPGERTEGRNHGKTSQGAFMFGTWGPETRKVVVTEAFIKGIAFFHLHRDALKLGTDCCIMARSGAKPTLEIVPMLKARGCEAIVANDNDFTGRVKARAFKEECDRVGVPCIEMFVEPAEVTVTFSHQEHGELHTRKRAQMLEENLVAWASNNGVPWAFDRELQNDTTRAIRLPNTRDVILELETYLQDDRRLSGLDFQQRAKGLDEGAASRLERHRWVKVHHHHKDWDDLLKMGPLVPRIPEWSKPRKVSEIASEIAKTGMVPTAAAAEAQGANPATPAPPNVQAHESAMAASVATPQPANARRLPIPKRPSILAPSVETRGATNRSEVLGSGGPTVC